MHYPRNKYHHYHFLFTDYPSQCATIGYGQVWERVDGGDTTNSILRKLL